MDKNVPKFKPIPIQMFEGAAVPVPPQKRKPIQHLPTEEELAAKERRWWYVTAGAALAALAVGILVGRFLIP
jgi:hypothetical protein